MSPPGRIVALGVTYRDHARETGERIDPAGPVVFSRDPGSFSPGGDLVIPSRRSIRAALDVLQPGLGDELARRLPDFPALFDYEIEVGLQVLDGGRIAFRLCNDATVRTVQILGEGQPPSVRLAFWRASKSFASTMLLGETLLSDVDLTLPRLPLQLRVNGVLRQDGHTDQLMYPLRELIRHAGGLELLAPGDLILTGTPGGIALSASPWKRRLANLFLSRWGKLGATVRAARRSGRFLAPGDEVEMTAGALGTVRAKVVAEPE